MILYGFKIRQIIEKNIVSVSIIFLLWGVRGSGKPCSLKTGICLSLVGNIMTVVGSLRRQGSVALTYFSRK